MPARLKPSTLGPFVPGMNNRRPDFSLQPKRGDDERRGDYLRHATNADISSPGSVVRRKGYARVLTGSDCHSLWADDNDAFMVEGQSLKRITGLPDDAVATEVRSGLPLNTPMSFARAPDGVYYSDGRNIGRVSGGTHYEVSTPPLAAPPSVRTLTGGSLPAGRYGFCFTHRDAAGRESGSTAPTYVEVADDGIVEVSDLPTVFPSGVTETIVYMTSANDQTLMRAATLTAPQPTLSIPVMPLLGARCITVLLRAMPAGDIVRYYRGRLLVAAGSLLYYSMPFMHGLFNPTRGYMAFGADITVVEPTTGGLWVCADQTYWLGGGEIEAAVLDAVLPYGGVRGSGGAVPNSNDVYWMSPRGIVVATQAGQAANKQEANVAVPPSRFSAGLFRETDGNKQIVESTFSGGPNMMAASSYMEAEILRKKVTL